MIRHGQIDLSASTPSSNFYDRGRFGRLFPTLPPFARDTRRLREALMELGAKGGPMDAGRPNPDGSPGSRNLDNPTITAGFTYLGQFLDHDMTFDPTSSLARRQDPESIRNFRIPALDLDSVYGGGPTVSPHLYDIRVDRGRTTMLTERIPGSGAASIDGKPRFDLPRNSQRTALCADPRNDENLITSQLHLALLRFHNRVVADVREGADARTTTDEMFDEASRLVRWHYQWIVLHELLARTVGTETLHDVVANGPRHFTWRNEPYIPVEFSVGAYRFGHSQVRPTYRANFGPSAAQPERQFFAQIFNPAAPDSADPPDLRGGKRAPRRFIDWQSFFDFGDGRAFQNKKIDTVLSAPLFDLLGQPQAEPVSLASRNLLRNLTMKVPSGQRVARAMGLPELAPADLDDLKPFSLNERTPLWFYVLREAEVVAGGERLGPVGGRIVAEVIVGLMLGDSQSFLRQDRSWQPTYGQDGTFTMVDLLRVAGVVSPLPLPPERARRGGRYGLSPSERERHGASASRGQPGGLAHHRAEAPHQRPAGGDLEGRR